jgi:cysteine-S-conjugate beta-lyase
MTTKGVTMPPDHRLSLDLLTEETFIIHAGRTSDHHYGALNTPVYRASTILFKDYATFKQVESHGIQDWRSQGFSYGRHGNPTTRTLAETIAGLEGGDHCFLTPSGVSAIATTFMAFLKPHDHVLVADCVYGPTRLWLKTLGEQFHIQTTYFDPCITPEAFETLFTPQTQLVFFESPGSLTFEISDIPALSAIAHEHGAVVALDNTWATPLYFKAFEKGVDISIQAATKYIMGHSDGLMGTITCKAPHKKAIERVLVANGNQVSGDEAYLAMRGLRTMAVRLAHHEKSAFEIATWLEKQPLVKQVISPALPSHPQHDVWKRDFKGACGLFAFVLDTQDEQKIGKFIDGLRFFGLGYSWGGYESLVLPCNLKGIRSSVNEKIDPKGTLIRLHIGLENSHDLKEDLYNALKNSV